MNALDGRFAARQITGTREYQEDDFGLVEPSDGGSDSSVVLLLADGMGGHVGGATASATVIRTFAEQYSTSEGSIPDRLRACLSAANEAIAKTIEENPGLDGMGSTLIAAVVSPLGLEWISVGDSPLWLFRSGGLQRLNADHSMAPALAKLVNEGRMTAQDAATDPNRHALRSAVVGEEISLVDVSPQPVPIQQDDHVLLGSDGLFTLDEDELARILDKSNETSPAELADTIVQAVEDAGHVRQDNTTVLLYAPVASRIGPPVPTMRRKRVRMIALGVLFVAMAATGALLMNRADLNLQTVRAYLPSVFSVPDAIDDAIDKESEQESRESKQAVGADKSENAVPADSLGESAGE